MAVQIALDFESCGLWRGQGNLASRGYAFFKMAGQSQKELNRARELLVSGDAVRALPLFLKLTRQHPNVAALWYECGTAALKARQLDVADRAWSKSMELEPRNAELIGMIGHQYEAARRPDKARVCFERAATADPRGINSRISVAVLLEKGHRLDEARLAVAECLAIDPRDEQARYFSAVLDRRQGKIAEAEIGLRDLISAEPRHPFVRYAARYELAQVLDRTDRFDEAMRLLSEAKEIVGSLTDTAILQPKLRSKRRQRAPVYSKPAKRCSSHLVGIFP